MSMQFGQSGRPSLKSTPPPDPPARTPPSRRTLALRRNRTTIMLWLIVAGLAIFFVPLMLIANTIHTDTQRLNADLADARSLLSVVPTPIPEVQQLTAQLTDVQSQTQQLAALQPQLDAARPSWPQVMAALGNYDPALLDLQALNRTGNQLTISGRAVNNDAVVNYAHALEQTNQFNRVIVQSIKALPTPIITATPTLTPGLVLSGTATLTPTLTPSPTPDQRDEFEPDNTVEQAKPIAIGATQLHNFFPGLDVDTETFLAKSGRIYRVATTDLTPGVDTFLTVSVGDRVYSNDDAEPGVLASEIIFQNTGADAAAVIRVTNRGEFGPDKSYQLLVEELLATPTPAPAPTATPANTATPPPDLRDAYEPDEVDPRTIIAAQPQLHNFYPDGDFDQVSFLAKSERFYRLFTTDLAPGVDTFLTVSVGGQTYTNDDGKPGTLASEIDFQVTGSDEVVTARVTNRGQYGADKTYQLVLEEFVPTPTVPAPTPTAGVTPAPTPDARDAYEPDDVSPAPIAPGQTQARNFYPAGDVDQVTFNAKAGRNYIIYTSDLALGVDTFVTATLDGQVYANDDYAPPGSNNYASAVCFSATVDAPATAMLTNKQLIYGPTRVYSLTVNELVSLPDPCTPSLALPLIVPSTGRASGRLVLSGGSAPVSVIPWLPQIAVVPQREQALLPPAGQSHQPVRQAFLSVEFVIIVDLKVTPP